MAYRKKQYDRLSKYQSPRTNERTLQQFPQNERLLKVDLCHVDFPGDLGQQFCSPTQ